MDREDISIQTHLMIIQGVIKRMADNSTACKFWCLTLVSAILVLVSQNGKPDHVLVAFVPAIFLLVTNVYYHIQERRFRASYDIFVERVQKAELHLTDVYRIAPSGSKIANIFPALCSVSIYPFYGMIILMIILAWQVFL